MGNDLDCSIDLAGFTGELLPHQREGLDFLIQHPRCLLADDVGLGKTVQGLALFASVLAENPDAKALVLTDLSVVDQWLGEAARFLPGVQASALDQVSATRGGYPALAVGNYDAARKFAGGLERQVFNLVILDEVSALKGSGKNHDAVLSIASRSERVVGMTATALETTPEETFAILRVIGTPGLFTTGDFSALLEFAPARQVSRYQWSKPECIGFAPGGAQAFRLYLEAVALRRTAQEVGLSLPERVGPELEWVKLGREQLAAYEAAEKIDDPLRRYQAREAASRLSDGGDSALIDAAMQRWDAAPPEKTVGYAFNKEVLKVWARELESRDIVYVTITGEVSKAKRVEALRAFRDDPQVMFLLGTDALQRGLNLQHCRRLWSLDSTWNPAKEWQREGRIRRFGSPHQAFEHVTFLPDVPLARGKWAKLARRAELADSVGL